MNEFIRYSRQNLVSYINKDFNKIINSKKILLIGCGGIGSPLAELLVRGGFNNLILIDNDIIDESNLSRQIYFENDIGKYKVSALKEYLIKINSNCKETIKTINEKITIENIELIGKDVDLIVDATDNFETRKIINNFCEKNNLNWLYNGAIKTEIISYLFYSSEKNFEKIFSNDFKNEKCDSIGILPSTTFIASGIAYTQILKYFNGYFNDKKNNKLIKFNIWTNKLFEIKI